MTDVPKSAAKFVEATLRSCIEADRIAAKTKSPQIRRAESRVATNGFVAALAMSSLRRHAPARADVLAGFLDDVFARGNLTIPARRIATALDYDYDAWIAQVDERVERRAQQELTEGGAS
ncbi:hypothetical protein [Streptomyces sp. URMC 124]|uniref:hypothetical protein n=1 Tax=Streptomyces sp. URMC 124 TaxID=3423405 RepID=UPI003F1B3408